jgi:hypothetical protein
MELMNDTPPVVPLVRTLLIADLRFAFEMMISDTDESVLISQS